MSKKQDKWLQVNSDYSGIDTNGLVVRVGVYPVGAPELYGASDSLVEHGSAEWVDAPEPVAVEDSEPELKGFEGEVESTDAEAEALETLDKSVLREMLDEKGIDHSKAKTKADLLQLFEDAE